MRVTTKTTLPILPSTPPVLHTSRLLLRPFAQTDLPFYLVLRRQPEVMKWTSTARCDETIAETEEWMARFLPCQIPQKFSFSIEELGIPGIVVGSAGVYVLHGKQPEIGYMLCKEVWGKGYATEAVRAILEAYWGLERTVVEICSAAGDSKQQHHGKEAAWRKPANAPGIDCETLLAVIEVTNGASRRILEKHGFVKVREYRDCYNGGMECVSYVLRRPDS